MAWGANIERPSTSLRPVDQRRHTKPTIRDVLVISGFGLILAWPSIWWPLTTLDESILLVYPEQVRSGFIPHRDFFTVYGPAPFYALAGMFAAFGSSVETERAFGLATHIAVALACYTIGSRRNRAVALLAAALSLTIMLPLGSVAYAWLGAMACLTGALAAAQRPDRLCAVMAGVLAGLSASFRPELLPVAGLVLAASVWGQGRVRPALLGAVLGLSPLMLFSVAAGAPMIKNIVLGRVGVNGSLGLMNDPALSAAVILPVIATACALVWIAWLRRTGATLAQAFLALGVLPQTLQRTDLDHAIYSLCVTVPLLAMAVMPRHVEPRVYRRRLIATAGAVVVVGLLAIPSFRRDPQVVPVNVEGRSALLGAQDASDLLATRQALLRYAPRNGTVFVGSTDMSQPSLSRISAYYFLPELRPSAYYLELAVGVSEQKDSGVVDDIRNADVLLLSTTPDALRERLFPHLPKGSDDANELVRRAFCPVAETGWGLIYQRQPCANATGSTISFEESPAKHD